MRPSCYFRTSCRTLGLLHVLGLTAATTGCDAFGSRDETLLHVYSAHHATPEDGVYPDRGAQDMSRTFENDGGWEVTLTQSFVTINALTLTSCDGTAYPLEMFWGPCPENLHDEDLEALTVAGVEVPAGTYCSLSVEYAPFDPQAYADAEETTHVIDDEAVHGSTIFLRGGARRDGGDWVTFELRSERTIRVHLDLSNLGGQGPLRVSGDEDFPKELTVTKTYDRFFDGVDFANFDAEALEQQLPRVLIEQTRVIAGTVVKALE